MRWMTPHVLAVLSAREELVLLDAVTLQAIDSVPLRDAELVYQPHFASLAAPAAAASSPASPTTPAARAGGVAVRPVPIAAPSAKPGSKPAATAAAAERFINIFTQSLRVQRQSVVLLVRAGRSCLRQTFSVPSSEHAHHPQTAPRCGLCVVQGLREVIVCQLTPWTSRIESLVRQKDYNQAIHVVRGPRLTLLRLWPRS